MRARRRSTNDGAGGGAAFRQHGAPAHQGQGAVGPPPFFRIGARDASEEAAEAGVGAADGYAADAAWTREASGEEAGAGAAEAGEKPSGSSCCGRKVFSAGAALDGAAAGETAEGMEEAGWQGAGAPEARDASEETAEAGAGAADGCAAGAGEMGTAGAPEASCEVRLSGSGRREAGNTSGVNSSG